MARAPLAAVGVVLLYRAVPQVLPAVVQAVVVDVIADQVSRRVHDLAVHLDPLCPASLLDVPDRITAVLSGLAAPAELREPDVVLGIDLGEAVLGEREPTIRAVGVLVHRQGR